MTFDTLATDTTTLATATLDTATAPYADDSARSTVPPFPKARSFLPTSFLPAPTISTTATATPRERAYTLHLQGYRSPAIAAHLGVPERTIRHWIQQTNHDLNALPALAALAAFDERGERIPGDAALDPTAAPDQPNQQATASTASPTSLTTLQHQRTLAVERHRARSAAAWALHEQLRATLDPFLTRVTERLLLHTHVPDDAENVSMDALIAAGGSVAPAFRAMYQLLPSLITGLTRSLTLAERADLQLDRLLGLTLPAHQPQPSAATTSTTSTTTPAHATPKQPTREEINRAVEAEIAAERAAEDAYMIPRLTAHERRLIRTHAALPDPLPDGPIDWDNLKVDPNGPLTAWREVLFPHGYNFHAHDDDDDDPDTPYPTPASGTRGKHSGKHSGNKSGKSSGNQYGTRTTPARPSHRATNHPTRPHTAATATGGGKDPHATNRTDAGKDARTDAPNSTGNPPGNNPGNNPGNDTAHPTPPTSPHGPFPPREGGRG